MSVSSALRRTPSALLSSPIVGRAPYFLKLKYQTIELFRHPTRSGDYDSIIDLSLAKKIKIEIDNEDEHVFSIEDSGHQKILFCAQESSHMYSWVHAISSVSMLPMPNNLALVAEPNKAIKSRFGYVIRANASVCGDTQQYAVKVTPKIENNSPDQLFRRFCQQTEKDILFNGNSPFLLYMYYQTEDAKNIHTVTPYFGEQTLWDIVIRHEGTFEIGLLKLFIAQIALGIQRVHDLGYVHRDISLDNVMPTEDGNLALIGFSLAGPPGTTIPQQYQNLLVAPEILKGLPDSFESDWWSFGLLCFRLFHHSSTSDFLLQRQMEGESSKSFGTCGMARDFVYSLLNPNPTKRLGHFGLDQIKSHPFFLGFDWTFLERKKPKYIRGWLYVTNEYPKTD